MNFPFWWFLIHQLFGIGFPFGVMVFRGEAWGAVFFGTTPEARNSALWNYMDYGMFARDLVFINASLIIYSHPPPSPSTFTKRTTVNHGLHPLLEKTKRVQDANGAESVPHLRRPACCFPLPFSFPAPKPLCYPGRRDLFRWLEYQTASLLLAFVCCALTCFADA